MRKFDAMFWKMDLFVCVGRHFMEALTWEGAIGSHEKLQVSASVSQT
jgi:hypothetical protein